MRTGAVAGEPESEAAEGGDAPERALEALGALEVLAALEDEFGCPDVEAWDDGDPGAEGSVGSVGVPEAEEAEDGGAPGLPAIVDDPAGGDAGPNTARPPRHSP